MVESGEQCESGKSHSHSLSNITSRSSRDARNEQEKVDLLKQNDGLSVINETLMSVSLAQA